MERLEFMKHVYPEPNTGCWIWGGSINGYGYGRIYGKHEPIKLAHRISYTIFNGPINDLSVLHKCDVRCCVNPDHLFLGTQRDNVHDMISKGRKVTAYGESVGRSILTREKAIEIKTLYSTGNFTHDDISKKLSINRNTITALLCGITWKHVDGISDIPKPPKLKKKRFYNKEELVMKLCFDAGISAKDIAKYFKAEVYHVRNAIRYYQVHPITL
jgi:hypothetical protein